VLYIGILMLFTTGKNMGEDDKPYWMTVMREFKQAETRIDSRDKAPGKADVESP